MDEKENNFALNSSFIHLCQMNAAPEFNIFSDSSMGEPLKTMPMSSLLTPNDKKYLFIRNIILRLNYITAL